MKIISFEVTEWNEKKAYTLSKDDQGKITITQDGKKKVDLEITVEGSQKLIEALEYVRK